MMMVKIQLRLNSHECIEREGKTISYMCGHKYFCINTCQGLDKRGDKTKICVVKKKLRVESFQLFKKVFELGKF